MLSRPQESSSAKLSNCPMTRLDLGRNFDPTRPPTPAKPAATVLVLRPGPGGFEIFCIERSPRSSFLGGVIAFPGGQIDPGDADEAWNTLANTAAAFPEGGLPSPASPRAIAVAACREALEEVAIIPCLGGPLPHEAALALRTELAPVAKSAPAAQTATSAVAAPGASADPSVVASPNASSAPSAEPTPGAGSPPVASLAQALAQRGLLLDVAALRPFARWVTPEAEPRRYDAFFFLLRLPEGQVGESDLGETTHGFWATPAEVLRRFVAGSLMLAPPTLRCLELLAAEASIEAAFALAERQTLLPVCPQFLPGADPPALVLPGDPAHAIAERRVEGQSRFVLREGRFLSEEPPPAVAGSAGV